MLFNQQTRTIDDKNEILIQTITSKEPLKFITNANTIYKGPVAKQAYSIDVDSKLREKPTQLNEFNRQNRFEKNPYNSLKMKPVDKESVLLNNKHNTFERIPRCITDMDPYNTSTNYFGLKTTYSDILYSESTRNNYRNTYVCK